MQKKKKRNIKICNPPLHPHKYFPQQSVCFWKSQLMTHSEFKKKEKQGIFECINNIFSQPDVPLRYTVWRGERGQKSCSKKYKNNVKEKNISRKTYPLGWDVAPDFGVVLCAVGMELGWSSWHPRSLGSEVMEQVLHKACTYPWKGSRIYSQTPPKLRYW